MRDRLIRIQIVARSFEDQASRNTKDLLILRWGIGRGGAPQQAKARVQPTEDEARAATAVGTGNIHNFSQLSPASAFPEGGVSKNR